MRYPRLGLEALNRLDRRAFTEALGAIFEHSPWVAERAWAARPFRTLADLHQAMVEAVRAATPEERLSLLCAHPELGGAAVRGGALAPFSASEQRGAGLDALPEEEARALEHLNAAYRERFGFPFILCVRNHTREGIFVALTRRLENPVETEVEVALAEVFEIARYRLEATVAVP